MFNKQLIKQTVKLGWPISLQNILVTLLSMIDVIMVSHLGAEAIAAVGLSNRVMFVIMVILLGLGWGVGILSAQYYGAGETVKIRRSILIGCSYAILALVPIVWLNFYFADTVLGLGTRDSTVITLGEEYLWVTVPSLLFVGVILVFENALRSMNQVKLPLFFSSVSIFINVILNYWLINGGLGIEPLGVLGAAWATTISRAIQAVLLLAVLHKLKLNISIQRSDFTYLNQAKDWIKMLKLVLPMMFSFGIWAVGSFCYQLIFGNVGTIELAVISMLLPIEGVFMSLFFGIASACSISVGQHLGANRMDDAWTMAKTFSTLSPVIALLFGGFVLLAKDIILLPYADVAPETLVLTEQVFVLIALLSFLKVINMTFAMGVLRAGGDNRYCLITDTTCMWLISLPLTWLAAFYWQLSFVLVVLMAYSEEVAKMFMFGLRVKSKRWMNNLTHE
ncbi:MAG: MATE family efflux transporter [Gammaproteobacteria bacterium]|nr:MATE family efflux transporter [Gammaproteobacteria bacterium]